MPIGAAILRPRFARRMTTQLENPKAMAAFDYSTRGELFPAMSQRSRSRRPSYLRFAYAAEAVRYAIEELPPDHLLGTYLEVDEERFGREGIRHLYDSPDYPLIRRAPAELQ
jgi:hypothetical protein